MHTKTRHVTINRTFEVNLTLQGTEVSDDLGAEVFDVLTETITVNGVEFGNWKLAAAHMDKLTREGDWE